MKVLKIMIVFISVICIGNVYAMNLATEKDVARLKNDLLRGTIKVGKTRLKNLRRNYGDAANITNDLRKLIYEYEDLKIEFTKQRYWIGASNDGFKTPVYTKGVENLKKDIDSQKLVGLNITAAYITRAYGKPTELEETDEDGGISHYYYGNIRMDFENIYRIKKWRVKNLVEKRADGVLGSGFNSNNQEEDKEDDSKN